MLITAYYVHKKIYKNILVFIVKSANGKIWQKTADLPVNLK